jgi:hypothetical protein
MHHRSQKTSVKPFKDFFYRYSNYPCSFSSKKTPRRAPILVADSRYKERIKKLWFNLKIDDLTKKKLNKVRLPPIFYIINYKGRDW